MKKKYELSESTKYHILDQLAKVQVELKESIKTLTSIIPRNSSWNHSNVCLFHLDKLEASAQITDSILEELSGVVHSTICVAANDKEGALPDDDSYFQIFAKREYHKEYIGAKQKDGFESSDFGTREPDSSNFGAKEPIVFETFREAMENIIDRTLNRSYILGPGELSRPTYRILQGSVRYRGKLIQRKEELGPFLKKLRKSKKLSLRDVEDLTRKEISNSYLCQLENGKIKNPSVGILCWLSKAYAIDMKIILEKTGYVPKTTNPQATLA